MKLRTDWTTLNINEDTSAFLIWLFQNWKCSRKCAKAVCTFAACKRPLIPQCVTSLGCSIFLETTRAIPCLSATPNFKILQKIKKAAEWLSQDGSSPLHRFWVMLWNCMLSASNVASGDKALEMPSYGKLQTDVNVRFQNFIILFLFLLNGRFILLTRFDVTSLRSGVMRNKETYPYKPEIRRFGKCFWPSLETVSFSHIYSGLYRVSQEELTKLRESVPYVKLHRYNPKHLYPKLNGYGDNGDRKVWASGVSTYCKPSMTPYSPLCMPGNEKPLANIVMQWPWRDNEQLRPAYITWKPKDNYNSSASAFVVQFNGFMSLTSYFDVKYRY